MRKTLAILSPNESAYSETFIHAHKHLPFNVKFYYGSGVPSNLESSPSLYNFSVKERLKKRFNKRFSLAEHALMNSLVKQKVECVLAEYGTTACATLKVIQFLKLPLVVHFHGFDATNKEIVEAYRDPYKGVFAYARAIVAVSEKMKADLIALGCPTEKIIVTPCGPNVRFLQTRPAYSTQQFVAVARFVEIKGPIQTILAFKKVVNLFPKATLVMIGDGPLLTTCFYVIKSLELTNNVVLKGVLQGAEIVEILNQSLAFLQHSFTLEGGVTEGSPVAILEAQAAALPVVSTFHGGIPDLVLHNKTGFLVDEFDLDNMANSIIRLLKEKGLARKMGEAGRERVEENFTMEKHLSILAGLIDTAIY